MFSHHIRIDAIGIQLQNLAPSNINSKQFMIRWTQTVKRRKVCSCMGENVKLKKKIHKCEEAFEVEFREDRKMWLLFSSPPKIRRKWCHATSTLKLKRQKTRKFISIKFNWWKRRSKPTTDSLPCDIAFEPSSWAISSNFLHQFAQGWFLFSAFLSDLPHLIVKLAEREKRAFCLKLVVQWKFSFSYLSIHSLIFWSILMVEDFLRLSALSSSLN